jgi:hypothetical protein
MSRDVDIVLHDVCRNNKGWYSNADNRDRGKVLLFPTLDKTLTQRGAMAQMLTGRYTACSLGDGASEELHSSPAASNDRDEDGMSVDGGLCAGGGGEK